MKIFRLALGLGIAFAAGILCSCIEDKNVQENFLPDSLRI